MHIKTARIVNLISDKLKFVRGKVLNDTKKDTLIIVKAILHSEVTNGINNCASNNTAATFIRHKYRR